MCDINMSDLWALVIDVNNEHVLLYQTLFTEVSSLKLMPKF